MVERIRIGIPFFYNSNWVAGAYYISNLISALNLLEDEKKPHIDIFYYTDSHLKIINDISYPYLTCHKSRMLGRSIWIRAINKFAGFPLIKILLGHQFLLNIPIDFFFPAEDVFYFSNVPENKRIYWITDLQEHFLPGFFSEDEINRRSRKQKKLISKNSRIVFSSNSTRNDFFSIYPNAFNKTYILQFAVSHSSEYEKISINSLLEKYKLTPRYFFCANQFWAHKNHMTILKAVALLKNRGVSITVAFSGVQCDYRNKSFYTGIVSFIKENNIEENIRILGFIKREEQLKLMNESFAIIQPSLFEGWSTVVEDAKSLNKTLILSDIPVHREQATRNVKFFDPLNEMQLAEILENYSPVVDKYDYSIDRIKFADTIVSIFE